MTEMEESFEIIFPEEAFEKLSNGLLELYEPELKKIQEQLRELTKKQELVCRKLHAQNLKLAAAQHSSEISEIFTKVRTYKEKLLATRKKMHSIHDRTNKLKKRALKLEQNKQSEARRRAQQREKEEQLIGS